MLDSGDAGGYLWCLFAEPAWRLLMKLFPIAAALLVLSLVLGLGSTLAVAAERPSNPAQLLVWFLSLNKSRDTAGATTT